MAKSKEEQMVAKMERSGVTVAVSYSSANQLYFFGHDGHSFYVPMGLNGETKEYSTHNYGWDFAHVQNMRDQF